MAMIDYGAIAFKNGKLISTDMFTPMIDMVGWEDKPEDLYPDYRCEEEKPLNLKDNYFAYVGDKEKTVCFYKCMIAWVESHFDNNTESVNYYKNEEWFDCSGFSWNKWSNGLKCRMRRMRCDYMQVKKRNGYYVFKWWYDGDFYKVYFGYGVDFDLYTKTKLIHFVNYYRLPQHIIKRKIEDIVRWWKYDRKYM